jgi:glutathione S-transferase
MADELVLYWTPQTRAEGARLLLEELGVPYRVEVVDLVKHDAFLEVNPMGKVPTIRHKGVVVTEQVAIFLYLADEFADAGLAPAIGDPLRGSYLRWMAFYGSSMEPACIDRAMKREAGARRMSPYGDFESVERAVVGQLRAGPWLLGERFLAVDVLWGTALGWLTQFGIFPRGPEVDGYLTRFEARSLRAGPGALPAAGSRGSAPGS